MKKRWICALLVAALVAALLPGLPFLARATQQSTDMTVSDELIAVLKTMEGFFPYPRWDYAQYTVGYGTKCPDDKIGVWTEENPITEEEALALLDAELAYFQEQVNAFATKWNLTFQQHQFDALVSFSYNCGAGWTGESTGYLNRAVRSGDLGTALIYGLCLWSTAGGNYILIPRRMSEADMYINGVYKSYTEYRPGSSYPSDYKYVFLDGYGGSPKYTIHGYDAQEKSTIITDFKDIPTGVDENGNAFVYEFAGWFTEPVGGTQVTVLDGSLLNGTVLYAQWKDPAGKIVPLQKGETVDNLKVTVTGSEARIRTGPGTFYEQTGALSTGDSVVLTEVCVSGSTTWGRYEGGWIMLSNTDYEEVLAALPDNSFPKNATVVRDQVNYRVEPVVTDDPAPVGKYNKGQKIVIVEEKQDGDKLWGKMDNGYWICMDNAGAEYVIYDSDVVPTLESVEMLKLPDQLQYVQMNEELNIAGSVIVAKYSDGSMKARTLAREYTSGFDNATLGEKTLTVRYLGMTTSFTVEIVKATVTFQNYDGTVISAQQYAYGETVTPPGVAARPEDENGSYVFVGWDREVTPCYGNAVYTAVFELAENQPDYIPGDINGDEQVNEDDVIYLLYHVVFPDQYPITIPADYNADGMVNEDDVIYLLYHVVFPEQYPLTPETQENKGETQ